MYSQHTEFTIHVHIYETESFWWNNNTKSTSPDKISWVTGMDEVWYMVPDWVQYILKKLKKIIYRGGGGVAVASILILA